MMLSAIILAGGFSSRMGQPKAALRLNGKTLLEHQVEKLSALGIEEILVAGWEDCPPGTVYVQDVYPHRGPLSGIHAGLCEIKGESALVLPVDMPLVPPETLGQLIENHAAPITVLSHGGFLEPLVGIYDASLSPLCARILRSEHTGVGQLFDAAGVTDMPYSGNPDFLRNCNTPEEFEKIARLYEKE